MASSEALLPASKEVVLEIQLNKLINDFLFSGVGDDNASSACNGVDAEVVQNASCIVENRSQNADAKPWKMDNHLSLSVENAQFSENVGINVGKKGVSSGAADLVDDEYASTCLSNPLDVCGSMPSDHNNTGCPPTEDVRLDIHEQTPNLCSVNNSHNANKLKVFRLSKSLSVGGSVFCFAMQRQGEYKEKEGKERAPGSSIKLTRIGSLPCHNKAHNEPEKGFKHTCKKPPRPPRSPLEERSSDKMFSRQATSDAILVLHGTSRRARFERRKRHAGSPSSNASIWALIFTLLFALAMLGEGFWSQNSAWIPTSNSSTSSTITKEMKSNLGMPSMGGTTKEGGPYVSSQLEREMQMREFWMSKGLDPT